MSPMRRVAPSSVSAWLLLGLLVYGCAPGGQPAGESSRKQQLREIVDKNVGGAHLTRGMNGGTIAALEREVTARDLPVLQELLLDADTVVAMTVANVLHGMGAQGRGALEAARAVAQEKGMRKHESLIGEQLEP